MSIITELQQAEPKELADTKRLAAIVGQAFSTLPKETRDAMRYTVYSEVSGTPVKSGKELSHKLVSAMLERWASGWVVNQVGMAEINQIVREYMEKQGQEKLL